MNRMKFLKYGRWALGAAAAASATIVVTHCSTSAGAWSPSKPSNLPDNYSSLKWDYNWDKREPYSLVKPLKRTSKSGDGDEEEKLLEKMEKKKAKAIRHLILIRHGQYNMESSLDEKRHLTELGREQAKLTGIRLKNSGITFDKILSSNMLRALETTDIIMGELCQKGLVHEIKDPLLREGCPCLPEPAVSSWHPDQHYYEDGARIEAAFRKYFHRADPEQEKDTFEVIVCHANVIRYFLCRALQFPGEAWLRISLNNCSISIVSILPSGRVVLRSLGDSGHLPVDKVTRT